MTVSCGRLVGASLLLALAGAVGAHAAEPAEGIAAASPAGETVGSGAGTGAPIPVIAEPLGLPAVAQLPFPRTEDRAACAAFDPLRRPFFGDLHVHSTLSLDAATQGTRTRPRDAYRFARGEKIGIQPWDGDRAMRTFQIDRPLDFAAVTDHAELFGELHICRTPDAKGYDSVPCRIYRRWPRLAFFLINGKMADNGGFSFCGENQKICLDAASGPWQEIRAAAEAAYDRSPECAFTSFVAYEWTGAPGSNNLHRNVIFRNDRVPAHAASARDTGTVRGLWDSLLEQCENATGAAEGCEVMAIPHNSNLSGGLMFAAEHEDGVPLDAASAARRRRMEPLVELNQHKGDSECRRGIGNNDELCEFELLPYGNFGGKFADFQNVPPAEGSFVRNALRLGLGLEREIGENPFRFGVISSTDTHLGTPGAVAERGHPGHGGAGEPSSVTMPVGLPDDIEFSPGGLAVAWAEENSRDSLFEAMRRGETYSTSGPRIAVRFFGGWEYPGDLCVSADFAQQGYTLGVPMGGTLSPAPGDSPPVFAISALADAGGQRTPLERVQIVKGWLDDGGDTHEKVYEVAGARIADTSVDTGTCQTDGQGHGSLCTIWSDPDFDPAEPAFWYARVVEAPTCRWHTWLCNDAGVECAEPVTITEGYEECCDTSIPQVIRERAVTSAIWYSPPL